MTAQTPDRLINHCNALDLEDLYLYRVFVGSPRDFDNTKPYPLQSQSNKEKHCSITCCWRGHTKRYELSEDGALCLVGFEYPFTDNDPDRANEPLTGDFWLELRKDFFSGPRLFIPFVSGHVVMDEAQWIIDRS